MAPITSSVEISRRPEDVFAYVTDPSHLPDWQESVVSVGGEAPYTVGSTLDRVKAASGRLQKVTGWESEARHEFESAIHDAYESGTSTRQIARVAGVSHARVFQIVSAP